MMDEKLIKIYSSIKEFLKTVSSNDIDETGFVYGLIALCENIEEKCQSKFSESDCMHIWFKSLGNDVWRCRQCLTTKW